MDSRRRAGGESRWWLVHLLWALAIPAMAAIYALVWTASALGVGGVPEPSVLFSAEYTAELFDQIWPALFLAFEVIPIYAYYKEWKILARSDSEWAPSLLVWPALHVVLFAVFASPLYVARRWQKIGLPWWQVRSLLGVGGGHRPVPRD